MLVSYGLGGGARWRVGTEVTSGVEFIQDCTAEISGRSGSRGGLGGRSGCRRQQILRTASGVRPREKSVKQNLQEMGDLGGSDEVKSVIL